MLRYPDYKNFINEELDINTISTTPNYKDRLAYAKSNGVFLDKGTGRIVYDMLDGTVIKIAQNKKGIAQNLTEAKISDDEKYNNIIAPVVNHDTKGLWNIQTKAKPMTEERFEAITGFPIMNGFFYWLRFGGKSNSDNYINIDSIDIYYNVRKDAAIFNLLISKYNLDRFDIADISSWGELNGKAVLIDYGLTVDDARSLYKVNY